MKPTACECNSCLKGCYTQPGWFAPGEVEKLAEVQGITVEELARWKNSS